MKNGFTRQIQLIRAAVSVTPYPHVFVYVDRNEP